MKQHAAIKRMNGAVIIPAGKFGGSLRYADLRYADLVGADLTGANLQYANLRDADLDFSCWPLWCGSFDVTVSMRHVYQLCYHLCKLRNSSKTFRVIRAFLKPYANRFHRIGVDVEKIG